MIAEKYLKKRYQDGRQERQAAWIAWYQRWQEARTRGEDFDEPPPELKD